LDFSEEAGFNDIAMIIPSKGTSMSICKLSMLKDFNKLTAGKYRILVEVGNLIGYSHVAAEFELQ
jgi:hypothetical protein